MSAIYNYNVSNLLEISRGNGTHKNLDWVVFDNFITSLSDYNNYFEIFAFLLSLCGIVFNYFIFSITTSWSNHTSNSIWMKCFSICDALALLLCGVINMGLNISGFYVRFPYSFICKAVSYSWWAWGLNANMHVVALAVDRYFYGFPPKPQVLNTTLENFS